MSHVVISWNCAPLLSVVMLYLVQILLNTIHLACPWPALAESPRADPVQARCSRVQCLHGTASSYLVDELQRPADLEARRRLRSTSSSSLTIRRTRLSTVGDRAFPVAAARTWNSLPQHVTSAPSMPVFRGRLKAFLFRRSFPWLVTATFLVPAQWLSSFSDT